MHTHRFAHLLRTRELSDRSSDEIPENLDELTIDDGGPLSSGDREHIASCIDMLISTARNHGGSKDYDLK